MTDAEAQAAIRAYLVAHDAAAQALRPFVENGMLLTGDRLLELRRVLERRDAAYSEFMEPVLGLDPRI